MFNQHPVTITNSLPQRPSVELLEARRLLAGDLEFNFASFSDTAAVEAQLQWHGDTTLVGERARLTQDARYSQGNLWTDEQLAITVDTSFSTAFSFVMSGQSGSMGGDGIVFVLNAMDPSFLPQYPGGSLGYGGIYPSVAIEFDSNQSAGDANGNHVALHLHGDSYTARATAVVGPDLNSGQVRYAWIDYNGATDDLRVYLSTTTTKPAVAVLSSTLDLRPTMGSEAWVGFTSATGYQYNQHELLSWSFTTGAQQPSNNPPVAVDDSLLATQNGPAVSLDVRLNDSDPDGDPLTIASVGAAGNGSVTTNGQRVFYTPAIGYAGTDRFRYTISDGRGGTASAFVDIVVQQASPSGVLALETNSYSIDEDGGGIEVAVVRTGNSAGTATVDYLTSNGTAIAGEDYLARSGTLTFGPGEVRKVLTIAILDDGRIEGNESFAVSLDRVTGADLAAPRTALVTIVDDDLPPPPPPSGGDVPWVEDFNLPNGTTIDTGATAWSLDTSGITYSRAIFKVDNGRFIANNTRGVGIWLSGVIELGDEAVDLSLDLQSVGTLEATGGSRDWLLLEYRVDGGTWQTVIDVRGRYNNNVPATVTAEPIDGDTLQLRVSTKTTAGDERYLWDNVSVTPHDDSGGGGGGGDGLAADYFNNQNFTALALSRLDPTINLNWGAGSPAPQLAADTFSVRWTGQILPQFSERYTFHAGSDDGIRVWIDGQLVVDAWVDRSYLISTGSIDLVAGEKVDIKVEFYENTGDARATLEWSSPSQSRQIVPNARLFSTGYGGGTPTGQWRNVVLDTSSYKLTDIVAIPGSTNRLLAAHQDGRIFLVENGTLVSTPFADLRDEVNGTRDRGLLGLAVDPNFPAEPYVYALYTYDPPQAANGTGLAGRDGNGNRAGRLVRLTARADRDFRQAQDGEGQVLLGKNSTWANINSPHKDSTGDVTIPPSGVVPNFIDDFIASDSQSHTVGDLKFAQDGSLYVSIGDGTSYGMVDPRTKHVQDIRTLRGKVLRIDPDTGLGLPSNPFWTGDGNDNESRVWALGMRNPFAMALRPSDGGLFVSDVGWYTYEEINYVPTGGANFGWPWYEGNKGQLERTPGYRDTADAQAFYNGTVPTYGTLTRPTFARSHADGAVAFLAGDFVSGSHYPQTFSDTLLFTDFLSGDLEALRLNPDSTLDRVEMVISDVGSITSMIMGTDGYLYYVGFDGNIGRIEFS